MLPALAPDSRSTLTADTADIPGALHRGPPPAWWLLALEVRALAEWTSVLPALPILGRAPKGDGHAVMVFPGLSANDVSTMPLRRFLQSRNYASSGWQQGFNLGPRPGVMEAAREQLEATFAANGQRKVSLLGWSLGGIYARELAKERPEMVRCVITLGTPFAGEPRSTRAWRLYELASGQKAARESTSYDLPAAPPVPTTSIYSRGDGIVAWQGSIQQQKSNAPAPSENIAILAASHMGLGINPAAWWAVADRLAQPEGQWQPFSQSFKQNGKIAQWLFRHSQH